MSARYRSNEPRVIDETIDGEALIMDLAEGSYYICTAMSAAVWNALKAGLTVDEVAARLVAAGADQARATRELDTFVEALAAHELLAARTDADPVTVDAAVLDEISWPGTYDGLAVEQFTDLADLILLDPVHDVSPDGWPHAVE